MKHNFIRSTQYVYIIERTCISNFKHFLSSVNHTLILNVLILTHKEALVNSVAKHIPKKKFKSYKDLPWPAGS